MIDQLASYEHNFPVQFRKKNCWIWIKVITCNIFLLRVVLSFMFALSIENVLNEMFIDKQYRNEIIK